MFCQKCGSKLLDGDKFCRKCGTAVVNANMGHQVSPQTQNESVQTPSTKRSAKKKSKKWLIIPAVAVLAIALVMIMAGMGGRTDYIATVGRHAPFEVRKMPYTYEEVLNAYIHQPEWKMVRESDDVVYVDISGEVEGTSDELTVSIRVVRDPDDSRLMLMTPVAVNVGKRSLKERYAVEFLYVMFRAYDEKEEDITRLLDLTKLLFSKGEPDLTENYTNEVEGISFRYPDAWSSVDVTDYVEPGLEMPITVLGTEGEDNGIYDALMTVEKMPATQDQIDGLFASDQEVASNYTAATSLIETSVVELDGVLARKIVSVDSGDVYKQSYLYPVGMNVFRVELGCLNECAEKYERIFDAIMESYRITAMLPDGSYMDDDNIGSTYANETPKDSGYGNGEQYTDYMYWGGCYDGGWMDTELWFGLYSDGTQDPECGYITTTFRGMENTGKLYYLGGNEFRWESEGYDSVLPVTYYVCAVYNDGSYQLDLYNSDGVYEVTFTLYEQYIP